MSCLSSCLISSKSFTTFHFSFFTLLVDPFFYSSHLCQWSPVFIPVPSRSCIKKKPKNQIKPNRKRNEKLMYFGDPTPGLFLTLAVSVDFMSLCHSHTLATQRTAPHRMAPHRILFAFIFVFPPSLVKNISLGIPSVTYSSPLHPSFLSRFTISSSFLLPIIYVKSAWGFKFQPSISFPFLSSSSSWSHSIPGYSSFQSIHPSIHQPNHSSHPTIPFLSPPLPFHQGRLSLWISLSLCAYNAVFFFILHSFPFFNTRGDV